MVVVLCDDYTDAVAAFQAWIAFLQTPPCDEIALVDRNSLRVETSDGLCYVFIDYRFKNVFIKKDVVFEPISEFLALGGIADPDPLRREWKGIIQ